MLFARTIKAKGGVFTRQKQCQFSELFRQLLTLLDKVSCNVLLISSSPLQIERFLKRTAVLIRANTILSNPSLCNASRNQLIFLLLTYYIKLHSVGSRVPVMRFNALYG